MIIFSSPLAERNCLWNVNVCFQIVSKRTSNKNSLADSEIDGTQNKTFIGGTEDGNSEKIAETRLILSSMLGQLAPYIVQPLPPG